MIWNYIRDFIVEHITGGATSHKEYYDIVLGGFEDYDTLQYGSQVTFSIGHDIDGAEILRLSFADWLASTLTAICMCLIVAFAIWLVIWVFKAVAHAFLLRR